MGGIRHLAAALALLAAFAGGPDARAQTPAFTDRFATLDETRWRVADGWTNGEWTANDWRRSQIRHTPGNLEFTLARTRGGEKRFSSGEIQSDEGFQYGYFEVRMRAPRGSGLVTGFFTYTRDGPTSTWDEIDIEILGRDPRRVQLTYFAQGRNHITRLRLPFDASRGMHTYAFEWQREYIRWYIDGQMVHEERGERGPLPQRMQRLYLHVWNTQTLNQWLGPILPWQGPWRANVGCIAYSPTYLGRQLCA